MSPVVVPDSKYLDSQRAEWPYSKISIIIVIKDVVVVHRGYIDKCLSLDIESRSTIDMDSRYIS